MDLEECADEQDEKDEKDEGKGDVLPYISHLSSISYLVQNGDESMGIWASWTGQWNSRLDGSRPVKPN